MTSSHFTPALCQWSSRLASALDRRSAPRLALLLLGAVLARGRRTVTAWIGAVRLGKQFRSCYTAVAAAGKRADGIAGRLALEVIRPIVAGQKRLTLALDDTPTQRHGPEVQGAGVHHNPTPGPAGSPFVYGHCWVVLGLLADHKSWGTIALPLLARLYVRRKDLPGVKAEDRSEFRTKLVMAVELLGWAVKWLGFLKLPIWVVADGAYAKRDFLKPAKALGITVVSRLRKDSALRTVPGPRPAGKRGRGRIYGEATIDLPKRAGQRRGWTQEKLTLYGKESVAIYKTFVATWRPAGGAIRVVLVDGEKGWRAYFCTDTTASVADILGLVAARFSLETAFRDCKQVVGAGQQQVRRLWANVGAFHVCLWACTMTEAWAWGRKEEELVDRSASPWDVASRRPSHADKRRAWRRELLGEEIRAVLRPGATEAEIQATAERLLRLAA